MLFSFFFFFNDTATTEIYTLSLHDALPIWQVIKILVEIDRFLNAVLIDVLPEITVPIKQTNRHGYRSEEHTSELQSRENLVCRLLLEKKKKKKKKKIKKNKKIELI